MKRLLSQLFFTSSPFIFILMLLCSFFSISFILLAKPMTDTSSISSDKSSSTENVSQLLKNLQNKLTDLKSGLVDLNKKLVDLAGSVMGKPSEPTAIDDLPLEKPDTGEPKALETSDPDTSNQSEDSQQAENILATNTYTEKNNKEPSVDYDEGVTPEPELLLAEQKQNTANLTKEEDAGKAQTTPKTKSPDTSPAKFTEKTPEKRPIEKKTPAKTGEVKKSPNVSWLEINQAIKENNRQKVQECFDDLIKNHETFKTTDKDLWLLLSEQYTNQEILLFSLIKDNYEDIFMRLIPFIQNFNLLNQNGHTLLRQAVDLENNTLNENIIKALLEKNPQLATQRDKKLSIPYSYLDTAQDSMIKESEKEKVVTIKKLLEETRKKIVEEITKKKIEDEQKRILKEKTDETTGKPQNKNPEPGKLKSKDTTNSKEETPAIKSVTVHYEPHENTVDNDELVVKYNKKELSRIPIGEWACKYFYGMSSQEKKIWIAIILPSSPQKKSGYFTTPQEAQETVTEMINKLKLTVEERNEAIIAHVTFDSAQARKYLEEAKKPNSGDPNIRKELFGGSNNEKIKLEKLSDFMILLEKEATIPKKDLKKTIDPQLTTQDKDGCTDLMRMIGASDPNRFNLIEKYRDLEHLLLIEDKEGKNAYDWSLAVKYEEEVETYGQYYNTSYSTTATKTFCDKPARDAIAALLLIGMQKGSVLPHDFIFPAFFHSDSTFLNGILDYLAAKKIALSSFTKQPLNKTLLHFAIEYGRFDEIFDKMYSREKKQLLIPFDINHQDNSGKTVLHIALDKQSYTNVDISNKENSTIPKLLEAYEKDLNSKSSSQGPKDNLLQRLENWKIWWQKELAKNPPLEIY